jgi:hypothetical protein
MIKQYQTLDSKIDIRFQTSKVITTIQHSLCMQPRLLSKYVYTCRILVSRTEVRQYYVLYIVQSSRNYVLTVLQDIKAPTFDYAVRHFSHTALELRCRHVTICLTSRCPMPLFSRNNNEALFCKDQYHNSSRADLSGSFPSYLLSTV